MAIVTTLPLAVLADGHAGYTLWQEGEKTRCYSAVEPDQEGGRNGGLSSMTREQRQHGYSGLQVGQWMLYAGALFVMFSSAARAQDIRGLEVCTAEKQMERRTGCLQANVELLQQELTKLTRETQDEMAASGRDLAAAQAEIAELKSIIAKQNDELAQLKTKVEHSSGK